MEPIDDSASFFSKEERLSRYKRTLERFSSKKFGGFGKPDWGLEVRNPCVYLYQPDMAWLHSYHDIDLEFCHLDFPEWYAQKPEYDHKGWPMLHLNHSWADMWHMRDKEFVNVIKFLEDAIKATENSIV